MSIREVDWKSIQHYVPYRSGVLDAEELGKIRHLQYMFASGERPDKRHWLKVHVFEGAVTGQYLGQAAFHTVHGSFTDISVEVWEAQSCLYLACDQGYALMEWRGNIKSMPGTIMLSPAPFGKFGLAQLPRVKHLRAAIELILKTPGYVNDECEHWCPAWLSVLLNHNGIKVDTGEAATLWNLINKFRICVPSVVGAYRVAMTQIQFDGIFGRSQSEPLKTAKPK